MRKEPLAIVMALIVAAATPATVFGGVTLHDQLRILPARVAFFAARNMWMIAFIIAGFHAVVFGLPLYFFTRRIQLQRWGMSLLCGFLIGTVPSGMLSISQLRFLPSLGRRKADLPRAKRCSNPGGLGKDVRTGICPRHLGDGQRVFCLVCLVFFVALPPSWPGMTEQS